MNKYTLNLDDNFQEDLFFQFEHISEGGLSHQCIVSGENAKEAAESIAKELSLFHQRNAATERVSLKQSGRPNILLITTDQQRRDSLSCYDDRAQTPNIDSLASKVRIIFSLYLLLNRFAFLIAAGTLGTSRRRCLGSGTCLLSVAHLPSLRASIRLCDKI